MALKKCLIYLLKLISVLVLIYLGFVLTFSYLFLPNHDIFKKDKFNQSMWLKDVAAGNLDNKLDCQRGRMAQDVIDSVLSINSSKEDVVKLLGEPNSLFSTSLDYELGWCGYIDSNSLRIDFNENRLAKAYILNH